MKTPGIATIDQLAEFDTIIDVRSPAEFADDHIPGAINCPVLDDEQRARVGTIYTQASPFEARKIGAVLVAENIARHLQARFLDRPKHWRPLVYCWRGGQRSGAMTIILRQIGWNACQLQGGYKTYRHRVLADLETLPRRLYWRVLCGATGSAKTRTLQALARQGGQVVDLEELAAHKGSVLGVLPGTGQPSQRWFETRLAEVLRTVDPERPVYVEAESRRIGMLQLPTALVDSIRAAECLEIRAGLAARVDFLLRDYDYFLRDPAWLSSRLETLKGLQSRETVAAWQAMVAAGQWPDLVAALLERHYDPLYARSQSRHYEGYRQPRTFFAEDLGADGIQRLATEILAS